MEESEPEKSSMGWALYFLLFLSAAVLVASIYLSISLPSKEEFVELYWSFSQVNNLRNVTQVTCAINNCGTSGMQEVGYVSLAGGNFSILISDLGGAGNYGSFCPDLNGNGRYCETGEGPYRYYETFFIGPRAFSTLYFNQSRYVFANYPKYVLGPDFTVGFFADSHYSRGLHFDLTVTANRTMVDSETMVLNPGQMIFKEVNVSLPNTGLFDVQVNVTPSSIKSSGSAIDFWVQRQL